MARVKEACKTIREELMQRLGEFHEQGKLLEEERLDMRTRHDLESLEEFGFLYVYLFPLCNNPLNQ